LIAGAVAALGSSCTWAYASARYALASRDVGSQRVNLARAVVVVPVYWIVTLAQTSGHALDGVTLRGTLWLLASTLCSYALGDNLFFTAARRLGTSTALSIASTYPLWAAAVGAIFGGEHFGPARALGTVLCVGGVIALVRLSKRPDETHEGSVASGFVLACITSLLWAGNSVSIKHGSLGLGTWQANAIRYSLALVLLSAQVRLFAPPSPRPAPTGGWRTLLPPIVADAIFGSVFYVYGLAHSDLAVGATLSALAPLISVPFAIALGSEKWSAPRFAAIATTVAGIAALMIYD
jgi:drug/metabolite transporter (DMT)-like permease